MAPFLRDGDLTWNVADDAAFLTLLDPGSYAKDLPEWEYETLHAKLVDEMNAGHAMAWGNPEVDLNIRVTLQPPPTRANAVARGVIDTGGTLCLAGFTSLTMCAQFADSVFPQPGDLAFDVLPGRYAVSVHRSFAHEDGEQFPVDERPGGDDYVVVLGPAPDEPLSRFRAIPWAAVPDA